MTIGDTPKLTSMLCASELACTMFPEPNAATDTKMAKIVPSHPRLSPLRSEVHGAASHRACRVRLPVVNRNHDLGVLRAHPENTRRPQPEHCTRAAQRDGRRDPGDVADSDRRGQGRGDRLEWRDITFAGALLGQLAEHFPERESHVAELQSAGQDGQEQPGAHQQHDHGPTPHEAVERAFPGIEGFHHEYVSPTLRFIGSSARRRKVEADYPIRRSSERPFARYLHTNSFSASMKDPTPHTTRIPSSAPTSASVALRS